MNQDAGQTDSFPIQRFGFLDGIRGLAALYVLEHHIYLLFGEGTRADFLPPTWTWLGFLLVHGRRAVDIFIVLSGFCLALPIAKSPTKELRGGVSQYLIRRSRRILPAYYATLAISLLLIWAWPSLRDPPAASVWSRSFPALTAGAIASHLLLVHDLFKAWQFKINSPLWSVSLEYQIYFLLPLVFLPAWRRAGLKGVVLCGLTFGVIPWLVAKRLPLSVFVALFAMGIVAAQLSHSSSQRSTTFWGMSAGIGFAFALTLDCWVVEDSSQWTPRLDALTGLATMCGLIYLMQNSKSAIVRMLSWPPIESLGTISYSLYLIHMPIIAAVHEVIRKLTESAPLQFCAMLAIGTISSLVCAFLCYILFERPFMTSKMRINITEHPAGM